VLREVVGKEIRGGSRVGIRIVSMYENWSYTNHGRLIFMYLLLWTRNRRIF
jgi:hypothetical protein